MAEIEVILDVFEGIEIELEYLDEQLEVEVTVPQEGGTSDHAALQNLDFDTSGHTGFARENHAHSDKADLVDGKVPAAQLPSYVDDVIEGELIDSTTFNVDGQPVIPESGKIYSSVLGAFSGKSYRWSGSQFVITSSDLTLGETANTGYQGDKGKKLYDERSILFSTILTQTAASIVIDRDNNNNAFSLDKVELMVILPSFVSSSLRLRVNNIFTQSYNGYDNIVNATFFNIIAGVSGGFIILKIEFDQEKQTVLFDGKSGRLYSGAYSSYALTGFMNFGSITSKISSIVMYPGTGDFPIGTKIILRNAKTSD